tara:strand:- start:175 stop:789 length:615 start_codon:yes stop_codon:yes gene_type:complete
LNLESLDKALIQLSKDYKMEMLINEYGIPKFNNSNDNFNALVKSIIYQQLSGKVASIIYSRFLSLFSNSYPNAKDIIMMDKSIFRDIGLSKQKSSYILALANYFSNYGYKVDFDSLSDIDVSNELIKIKGIGQWTIDMFLMFTLKREDILPVTDLGIQKGIQILYEMKNLPSKNYIIRKANKWKPYRTIACWYLWRIVDEENFW